ncbi:bifunctional DNA-formamidopyrimidine glycosylase/DNA-(apurinic or apyrimidinic site) lyase [Magnetospirillum sp. UT-4]|uniref:bifunctional DNA-formamidopyrimidine glycosylase/DNA-(apurinic or apyrimidinic site) lyase n=1 Tax=Magnetospirillum sp. UT-4 TaxID=2681467 RepID=UPI00138269B0|nr:bifunctional DNA-formamidopyrimidine glycosylase/DNA-(apurinic or apyrimidinic site) lyase [Magnetospirillum sp. UT-4]CAA7611824.1 Formamidopyrimidine-DNA glycosylase [Magnetospirillum sp. UT-4]
MPELPEVETVARGLAAVWLGRRFARVECRRQTLRKPLPEGFAERLAGRLVEAVGRRAKYLVVRLDGGLVMLGHLGMSGSMVIAPGRNAPPGPHDHIDFHSDDGGLVVYRDPRRFGLLDLCRTDALDAHPLLAGLGPEPLEDAFTPAVLAARLAGKATPIKVALLDQTLVAGLGNIYVSESLFRAGILPTRGAGSLKPAEIARLVPAVKAVLTEAVAAGGSSLKDHVRPSGELGYFQHSFAVYDREGAACPGCVCDVARTGGVRRIVQAGRSTFYCAKKQR